MSQYNINDLQENITYCFNEDNDSNNVDLSELINEFEQMNVNNASYEGDMIISEIKNYELNYTIKQLTLICDYYGLTKQTKTGDYYGSKAKTMKKIDIISLIVMFENNIENIDIVMRRKELWFFLDELKSDKTMKKFVIW